LTLVENATVPLPVPEPPLVIVSHAALDVAVHAHDAADAVTANVPVPPLSATFWLDGEIVNVHVGGGAAAAACDIVNVLSATVTVPVRAAPVFVATANATAPFPLPAAADVIVIHPAFDFAVHGQPALAVTANEPVVASALTL